MGAMSVTGTKGPLRRDDAPHAGAPAKMDLHHAQASVNTGLWCAQARVSQNHERVSFGAILDLELP